MHARPSRASTEASTRTVPRGALPARTPIDADRPADFETTAFSRRMSCIPTTTTAHLLRARARRDARTVFGRLARLLFGARGRGSHVRGKALDGDFAGGPELRRGGRLAVRAAIAARASLVALGDFLCHPLFALLLFLSLVARSSSSHVVSEVERETSCAPPRQRHAAGSAALGSPKSPRSSKLGQDRPAGRNDRLRLKHDTLGARERAREVPP